MQGGVRLACSACIINRLHSHKSDYTLPTHALCYPAALPSLYVSTLIPSLPFYMNVQRPSIVFQKFQPVLVHAHSLALLLL